MDVRRLCAGEDHRRSHARLVVQRVDVLRGKAGAAILPASSAVLTDGDAAVVHAGEDGAAGRLYDDGVDVTALQVAVSDLPGRVLALASQRIKPARCRDKYLC